LKCITITESTVSSPNIINKKINILQVYLSTTFGTLLSDIQSLIAGWEEVEKECGVKKDEKPSIRGLI